MQVEIMKTKLQKDCPDYEDVSAFLDGELDPSSSVYNHIDSCEKCRKRVEEYRKINLSISKELASAVPDNYAANLVSSIKKRQAKENNISDKKLFPFHIIMKVAAIVIVSAVAFFIVSDRIKPEQNDFDPATAEPLVFLNKPDAVVKLSQLNLLNGNEKFPDSDSIDMNDLMNVSMGKQNDNDLINKDNTENPVAFIHPEVSQAWSVDDLSEAETKISEFAENVKFTEDRNGNVAFTLTLTKEELAEFVRKCKAAGFRLLSPVQPQPEQTTFAGKKDDKVSYNAVLIKSE